MHLNAKEIKNLAEYALGITIEGNGLGVLGYDEVTDSLVEKGVIDELYYCECNNCGNCFDVVTVGSRCDNCNEGTMHPQDVEPWE